MSSGEGAEEAAKDAADIAAFFKSAQGLLETTQGFTRALVQDGSLPKCETKSDASSQVKAGKMDKSKDLSEFDKGQIVMARPLDQNISKTAALVGCSRSAVDSVYQK
ncbi:hypothetical protein QTP70_014527 [Hemibagrus guttatus]|uniref:Uncharacterized protein n=1 Tax=Hemibagrus guttatus TaxID=175788 RepID=A0AAE0Q0W1_9TELE|nr:hypothetical protein QTP70_014527 [Hemibagrus guttatus]